MVDNTSYQRVVTVQAGNGYKADLHDFHLVPHGTGPADGLQPDPLQPVLGRRPAAAPP